MRFEPPISRDLWDQIPPAAQAALVAVLQHYQERIAALEARVRDLEQRLGQNSTNSSKPPSSDGPQLKRRPPKPPSGRPRGGQDGHPRRQRPLLSPTDTRPCKPSACRRCGRALHGEDPQPLRYQVLELPEIKPSVIEYQLHRLACPCCGITTCAALPEGAAQGGQGPRLQALLALLTGAYRLSKRQAGQLLGTSAPCPSVPRRSAPWKARRPSCFSPSWTSCRGTPAPSRLMSMRRAGGRAGTRRGCGWR